MTLWKTMLSVGWCHHQLFIMPFAAISLSNLLSRLNNLTFTFGMWRGRRASRGCCYLCVGGGGHTTVAPKHHHEGPVVTTAALPVWFLTLSAPADVSLASPPPHATPRHATPRQATAPHATHPRVRWRAREKGIRSLRAKRLLFIFILQVYRREAEQKASRFKKKKEQSRSLTINIYKYINIYINWIYCKCFPFLLCFSLYIGLHIL